MTDPRETAAATYLVIAEAKRSGRTWHPKGIAGAVQAAIDLDDRTPSAIVAAAMLAIGDPNAETPQAIRFDHYYLAAAAAEPDKPEPICATCGRRRRAHDVMVSYDDPHPWTSGGLA